MKKEMLFLLCSLFLINFVLASTVVVRPTTYYPDFYDCVTTNYVPCSPFINPENLFDTDINSYGTNTPWDGVSDWNMSNVLMKFDVPNNADLSQSYIFVTDNCGGGGIQRTVNFSIANAYLINGNYFYVILEGYETNDNDNAYWMELLTQEPTTFLYPNLSSWIGYVDFTEVFTWYNDPYPKVGYCPEFETLTKRIYDVRAEFEVMCNPSCTNKDCGDDGCGGSCGSCLDGFNCNLDQKCISNGLFIYNGDVTKESSEFSNPINNFFDGIINWFKNLF